MIADSCKRKRLVRLSSDSGISSSVRLHQCLVSRFLAFSFVFVSLPLRISLPCQRKFQPSCQEASSVPPSNHIFFRDDDQFGQWSAFCVLHFSFRQSWFVLPGFFFVGFPPGRSLKPALPFTQFWLFCWTFSFPMGGLFVFKCLVRVQKNHLLSLYSSFQVYQSLGFEGESSVFA